MSAITPGISGLGPLENVTGSGSVGSSSILALDNPLIDRPAEEIQAHENLLRDLKIEKELINEKPSPLFEGLRGAGIAAGSPAMIGCAIALAPILAGAFIGVGLATLIIKAGEKFGAGSAKFKQPIALKAVLGLLGAIGAVLAGASAKVAMLSGLFFAPLMATPIGPICILVAALLLGLAFAVSVSNNQKKQRQLDAADVKFNNNLTKVIKNLRVARAAKEADLAARKPGLLEVQKKSFEALEKTRVQHEKRAEKLWDVVTYLPSNQQAFFATRLVDIQFVLKKQKKYIEKSMSSNVIDEELGKMPGEMADRLKAVMKEINESLDYLERQAPPIG